MGVRIQVNREQIADFCRKHHIQKLAFFGSVLREDFRGDSDVDVLVEFAPGRVPGLAFFSIQDELSDILGRPVDLSTPAFLSAELRSRVAAEAEVQFVAT